MEKVKWVIDQTHSEIGFKVKHLMISSVAGTFNDFEGTVETDGDDFTSARISFSAAIDSISTNNEHRDAHLKNADFFDAEQFPRLHFESTGIVSKDEDSFVLDGLLSIRGISQPVSLNVEYGGIVSDPWGNTRAGFSLKGKINRSDFGIVLSMVSETGGIVLSEEVKISAEVQFVRQPVEEPVLV